MSEPADSARENDPSILLGVLAAVERDSQLTQRSLARELGIALGLVNSYLKRCAQKGLVKIRQAPLNRYAYYLTPTGFAEKSRLTAEYLALSLDFFRRSRADCVSLFRACRAHGWRHVALYGAGELAEIAVLSAGEAGIEIAVIVDPRATVASCAGKRVVPDLAAVLDQKPPAGIDCIVVTDTQTPQASFDAAVAAARAHDMTADRVVAPALLRISPAKPDVEASPP